jgi:hypothetical protein
VGAGGDAPRPAAGLGGATVGCGLDGAGDGFGAALPLLLPRPDDGEDGSTGFEGSAGGAGFGAIAGDGIGGFGGCTFGWTGGR